MSGNGDDQVSDDLDWVRQQLVRLDDRQRALPADDFAHRHELLTVIDGLRNQLQNGNVELLHRARDNWRCQRSTAV